MKKFIVVLVLVLIMGLLMISCSTGEQRNKMAGKIGEVLYQRYSKVNNVNDIFIVKNLKNELVIIYIDSGAQIWKIDKIKED